MSVEIYVEVCFYKRLDVDSFSEHLKVGGRRGPGDGAGSREEESTNLQWVVPK